jgi:hypothetical protein
MQSVCPTVHGREDIKRGIALQVLQSAFAIRGLLQQAAQFTALIVVSLLFYCVLVLRPPFSLFVSFFVAAEIHSHFADAGWCR